MDNKTKELINYFFKVMGDERFLRVLEKFANGEGYGIENVWCVFADDYEQWEEDYFGDEGIAFYYNYPAVEEDEEVILDYENFYKYLNEIVGQYVERHPENKSEVEKYMGTIKEKYKGYNWT